MPTLPSRRARPRIVTRDDSDDELGSDDHPWEWLYQDEPTTATPSEVQDGTCRKRRRIASASHKRKIIGARMGSFECRLGDLVRLQAERSNEVWVAIICEFSEDEEGDMAANFMWFSSEQGIRNKEKKRMDYCWNELYITPSWDVNSLTTINGKATVMSAGVFAQKYPTGTISRKSKEFGKVFVCRRGCNTRTATYTDEFVWEDVYSGPQDLEVLIDLVQRGTKASRGRGRCEADEAAKGDDDFVARQDTETDDEDKDEVQTPKRQRTIKAATPGSRQLQGNKAVTPSHRKVMLKKHLEFTPLATRVLSPAHVQSSPYQLARTRLHVAAVPTHLPCRETEFSTVYSTLEDAISDGTGTCIYISGTPGTGKTATVREVVSQLDAAVRGDQLDDFLFVEINGMKMTDPHQAYSLLWESLKGQRVAPAQALDLLETEFKHPSPRRVPCVVLMDELDQLVTRNQGVMYNFFNWPGQRHSRLIVLAVANTMDLPERTLSNKISSRLGLTRITFAGYNHEQLMRIVQSRLEGIPGRIVDADAVQFASRKVAAVSGDARRALDICRRAVELAEADAQNPQAQTPSRRPDQSRSTTRISRGRVTIETVRRAINEATSNPLQHYLRALPFASRLLLAALVQRSQRGGLAESTYGDVLDESHRLLKLAGDDRIRPLALLTRQQQQHTLGTTAAARQRTFRPAGLGAATMSLTGAGIVHLEMHRAERPSKIKLAVGDDEVRLAFRDDPEIKALGVVL